MLAAVIQRLGGERPSMASSRGIGLSARSG